MAARSRRRVRFVAPERAEVVEESLSPLRPDEVEVRTHYSAISPGTERLVYRGEVPQSLPADASIEALQGKDLSYPLSYGYACVGVVETVGDAVDPDWKGAQVFGFRPHVSRFTASPDTLLRLPDDGDLRDAVLIPSVETAVTLVMDGRPVIGEQVLVLGQGVVGLLTTTLLARYPLSGLGAVDPVAARRARSAELGAQPFASIEAVEEAGWIDFSSSESRRADLVYELSGTPSVLNDAIRCTGYDGRVVVGSWYGTKQAPLDLGGRFHRSRIDIRSSQVSTIAPKYRGRWTKDRRTDVVLDLLPDLHPSRLISHEFSLTEAPEVYEQLAEGASLLQPIFTYDS